MSEDLTYSDWKKIAEAVQKELNAGNGVVITHGTDTLHYTAAAMSFMLNTTKPVVLVGSQRSPDRGSSDAFMNLVCAVTAAAKSDIAEVVTCLHGTTNDDYCLLVRGVKVRKMHTSRRDAFRPVNEMALAKVYANGKIEVVNKDYNKKGKGEVVVDAGFEDKVALVQVYPGMEPEVIDFYVKKKILYLFKKFNR